MNKIILSNKINRQGSPSPVRKMREFLDIEPPSLLSVREAAEFLDVTPQTLYLWRNKECNTLPFVRMGRHYKYSLSDLKKFIESKKSL